MKIFIFETVEKLTENWHSGGGLVILSKDLQSAIKLAQSKSIGCNNHIIELDEKEIENVISYDLVGEPEEKIFIFPDAGCC